MHFLRVSALSGNQIHTRLDHGESKAHRRREVRLRGTPTRNNLSPLALDRGKQFDFDWHQTFNSVSVKLKQLDRWPPATSEKNDSYSELPFQVGRRFSFTPQTTSMDSGLGESVCVWGRAGGGEIPRANPPPPPASAAADHETFTPQETT